MTDTRAIPHNHRGAGKFRIVKLKAFSGGGGVSGLHSYKGSAEHERMKMMILNPAVEPV